jgi:hypothetical protein
MLQANQRIIEFFFDCVIFDKEFNQRYIFFYSYGVWRSEKGAWRHEKGVWRRAILFFFR